MTEPLSETVARTMFQWDQAQAYPSGMRTEWQDADGISQRRYRDLAMFLVTSPAFARVVPPDATMKVMHTHANGTVCHGAPCTTPPTWQYRVWREPDRPYVPAPRDPEPDSEAVSS
jgi:hypothetical protein